MFETTPPDQPDSPGFVTDLEDPIGGVIAVELSRRFVRLCLSWAEPMTADLASRESMLRQPGGPELAERMLAKSLYHRIDPQVLRLLPACVPLAHAESAYSRLEEALRDRFGDVVRTAVSFLLSDDRDTAIRMLAVATTMAGRQVAAEVAAIIADTRALEEGNEAPL